MSSASSSGPFIPIAVATCLVLGCGGARDESSATNAKPSATGTPPTSPTGGPPACEAAAARDVAVASDDLNGYPPYALAECSLVYVSSSGALILRDLATSDELTLAPAAEKPRRPSISIDVEGATHRLVVAWEATFGAGPVVRVRWDSRTTTITGAFVMATEPRVRGRFVAFTAWKGLAKEDDTDVWLYDARTDSARLALGGAGQQRFADVSPTHVVATDFAEDPDGRFDGVNDLADIVAFEIASGTITRRAAPGKQAFPMLSDEGALAYLAWDAVHPEPKLHAYDLKAGPLFGHPSDDRTIAHVEYASAEPARPVLAGNTLEWIANPMGVTSLHRAPADGSAAPVRVAGLDGLLLYAPAPSSLAPFTVLAAAEGADRAPRLRGVGR